MQDINRDDIFSENESTSIKRERQQANHGVGTAFSELDKSRKIAVIFLAFFSIFLFITWGVTTKNRINNPLNPEINTEASGQLSEDANNVKNIDSDGDGLFDWEEKELYNTSPYLEDSDSDGISDSDEIKNGTNPVCFEGEDCGTDVLEEQAQATEKMETFVNENINLEISTTTGSETINEESITNALNGATDAETLRKMLLEAGMDPEILNVISDEDLLKSYEEILQ